MYTTFIYVLMFALVGSIAALAIIGVYLTIRELIRRVHAIFRFTDSSPSHEDS